ncbi:MAG: sigma-70 family RNA polymerase sigma factor [Pirellulales bacterium]|nr:sigma-70 family RNA polymerase sigma factor [Pirellulales bacterium]
MDQDCPSLTLAELVRAHTDSLYRYAYRLCGSATDAEDLVQQAFMLAQQNFHQLRGADTARAWLFALVRSAFGRYLRQTRQAPVTQTLQSLDQTELNLPARVPPDDLDPAILDQALQRLPPEYRQILVGFYFEECSYKELAARLEIPVGTVMSRLSRAKVWLREQLTTEDAPPVPLSAPATLPSKPRANFTTEPPRRGKKFQKSE